MIWFGIGALLATVGALPLLVAGIPKAWIAPRWVVVFAGWTGLAWAFPLQTVGPLGGLALHNAVMASFAMSAIANYVFAEYKKSQIARSDEQDALSRATRNCCIAVVGVATVIALIAVLSSGMLNAGAYRAFVADGIEQGAWGEDISPVDPAHLRQVSVEQAAWKGNKALSQVEGGSIGTRYRIGAYQIQKFRDELVWIAPLEYQSFSVWSSAGFTPGYVMVSAEDPNREPELVANRKLRYLDSAYFGDNLWRHAVSNGYARKGLDDATFEVDDDGNPFFVYTRFDLTIGYSGKAMVGALIVNPETGEMTEYAMADLPAWVDRIVPEAESVARFAWYGVYVNGWLNSWWGQRDVIKPTDSDLSLVWTNDGRACWFTGMTSAAETDNALVSIELMDSRTGQVREYRVDGAADEKDVNGAVKSAVSNYKDWIPTAAIPANVYGNLAWIVPVVNGNGVPQRIAIVSADASKVALGENVKQSLAEFRRKMTENGERVVAGDSAAEATAQAIVGSTALRAVSHPCARVSPSF